MAERLKGLTIGLDLDTIKVERGLKGLKATLRNVNSEMRANMSAFDYSDRSISKYTTRLTGLNKKLEVQKVATQEAKEQMERMIEEYGEGSVEAEKATREYNNQVAALNNLERYIGRTSDELRKLQREQAETNSIFYKSGESIIDFSNRLDKVSEKVKSTGTSLTKYLTVPIAGLISTVGGMGFKRAMDIEQVQMMMEHISDDASEYEKRMSNVVDLVTDTRFGTAELGAEYAKFIGASASDLGASLYSEVAMNLASFKSDDALIPQIGDLFTKSLQSGKIDGQMINQFTNAGVDILKVLGNKWGMEQDAVRKRLREGNFNIEDVLNELSEGILEGTEGELGITKAMGGMLEKSGQTLSGQIKNFFAAISIAGERLIKDTGLFDGVKDAFAELRNMLKSGELDAVLLPTFQGLAKALEAMVEQARKIFKWFSSLDDSTKELIGKMVIFGATIGPVLVGVGTFGGIVAKLLKPLGTFFKWIAKTKALAKFGKVGTIAGRGLLGLSNPIGWIITGLTLLGAGLTIAYKKSETFRKFVHKLKDGIIDTFSAFKEFAMPAVEAFKEFFGELRDTFSQFMKNEGPHLEQAFRNIGEGISSAVTWIGEKLEPLFGVLSQLANYLMPHLETVVLEMWEGIKQAFTGALDIIMGAIQIFSGVFTGDWDKVWEGIEKAFFGAIDVIIGAFKVSFVGQMLTFIIELGKDFIQNIKDTWNDVTDKFTEGSNSISEIWDLIKETASNSWTLIKNVVLGPVLLLINLVTGDMKEFKKNLSEIWGNIKDSGSRVFENLKKIITDKGKELKDDFVKKVKNMGADALDKFKELKRDAGLEFGRIKNIIIDKVKGIDLKQLGKDIIQGLIDGIKSKMWSVGKAVTDVTSQITGKIKSILKIASPSKVMEQFGAWTGEGLEIGVLKSVKNVSKAATKLAGTLVPTESAKQLALYGRSTSTSSPNTSNDNNLVSAISHQNEYLQTIISILIEILNKDDNVDVDISQIIKLLAPGLSKEINSLNVGDARKAGIVR